MTFEVFKRIVEKHRPDVTVFQHGAFINETSFGVSVVFNYGQPNESKVYQYNGSYLTVLHKLGIEAIEKKTVDSMANRLAQLTAENGKTEPDPFEDGKVYTIDHREEINRLTAQLESLRDGHIEIIE